MPDTSSAETATAYNAEIEYRLALSEFLRAVMAESSEIASGEEDIRFGLFFDTCAKLLDVEALDHWQREADNTWSCRNRWSRDDATSARTPVERILPGSAMAHAFEQLSAPALVLSGDLARQSAASDELGLSALRLPAMKGGKSRCVLSLTRSAAVPWQPHEIEACTELTSILQRTRERLMVEAQLAACFYDAPLGITLRSLDGSLIDCNQAFLDFLGRDNEAELLRHGGVELLANEVLTDEMLHTLANPNMDGYNGLELPFRHSDGTVVWGSLSVAPIQCGDVRLWLTHVEDVTVERAERARNADRASRDPLTGLANRHMLMDRLAADLGRQPISLDKATNAVLLFDLNGFKQVNDTHGHHVGDELLLQFGKRLSNRLRSEDLVARYGGDEFVVVIGGPLTKEIADIRAEDLRSSLDEPVVIDGKVFQLSAAIGVAVGAPGMCPDELLKVADAAMYDDKRQRSLQR